MNSAKFNRQAFTLVEMLVVIAILGILAALLLPALSASKMRAKRIVCESQLRQMGIAFHSFAHDHNGKFPMQVAVGDGGSEEFAQAGEPLGFRHFQPLAGILETPNILVCPADTRLPATNFAALQNSNVSYFVGVTAEYSQPMSILAGDGNLAPATTLLRVTAGGRLTWTREQHRYKGNVLFADAHIEEWSDGGATTLGSAGDFVLPSLAGTGKQFSQPATANAAAGNATASSDVNVVQSNSTTSEPNQLPTNPPVIFTAMASSIHDIRTIATRQPQIETSNPLVENVSSNTTNPPAGKISNPKDDDSMMSPFDRQIAKFLRHVIFVAYSLILLLFLFFAAYRVWRWLSERNRRR